MTTNKHRLYPHLAAAFVAVILSASAYPVYHNTVARTGLPIMVSFFWFSVFAVVGAFLYPTNLTAGMTLRNASLRERLANLYPDWPWKTWYRVTSTNGGKALIAMASAAGIMYFVLLLSALQSNQPNIVLTVVVLQQLNPLIFAIVGYLFLGDTCKSWTAYVCGTLFIAAGVTLYKYDLKEGGQADFFDTVAWLMLGVMICEAVMMVYRTRYRRDYNVDALEAGRTSQLVSAAFGLGACLVLGQSLAVTSEQLLGLAYLGIVPTAVSSILLNRAQDIIGIPWIKTAGALRPIYVLGWSVVPLAIFATDAQVVAPRQLLGIALACGGLVIVGALARPQPVKQG